MRTSRTIAIAFVMCMFATAVHIAAAAPVPPSITHDPQVIAGAALEQMARANFGDLSAAELQFVRHAPYRDLVWSSPSSDPDNPVNDAVKATSWGKERTIRADLIRWILCDAEAAKYVHPSGIGIAGARIAGIFDLSYETVTLPITLLDCAIPDGLDLSFSHLASMISDAVGPADRRAKAQVRGDVYCALALRDVNFIVR